MMESKSFLKSFFDHLRGSKLAENTALAYSRALSAVQAFLEERSKLLPDLSAADVAAYVKAGETTGLSATTLGQHVAAIKAFLKYLGTTGKETAPIIKTIKTPRRSSPVPKVVSKSKVKELKAGPDPSNRFFFRDTAILALLSCGVRPTELSELKVSNLVLAGGYIRVGKASRRVPLVGAQTAIENYLDNRPAGETDRLFVSRTGKPLERVACWMIVNKYAPVKDENGHISPRLLRNTYAKDLLDDGAGLQDAHELLGHLSIEPTRIYQKIKRAD